MDTEKGSQKTAEQKNNFAEGSVAGNIMSMAVPMTVAQILNLLYNVVDRIYIGHIPGADSLALTGVGLTFPIVSMISAFAGLFGMGGAPLCSIFRGKGDQKQAGRVMQNAFWMLVGTGLLITVIGYAVERPLLYALGGSDATYVYAGAYLKIYLAGSLFVMIGLGMNPFINAQGFGRMGMVTVALGAVINIVLDPLFIFQLHMGVRGAALATVIAQFCSAVWVLLFLTGKRPMLRLILRPEKPDWKLTGQIVALGTSNFVMNFTNSVVQVVCNRQLQSYGGDLYVGVMTVLNSVREVLTMVVIGMAMGDFTHVAKSYVRRVFIDSRNIDRSILFITYAGMDEKKLEYVQELVRQYCPFERVYVQKASSAIASNCGPGSFGLLFMRKNEAVISFAQADRAEETEVLG